MRACCLSRRPRSPEAGMRLMAARLPPWLAPTCATVLDSLTSAKCQPLLRSLSQLHCTSLDLKPKLKSMQDIRQTSWVCRPAEGLREFAQHEGPGYHRALCKGGRLEL